MFHRGKRDLSRPGKNLMLRRSATRVPRHEGPLPCAIVAVPVRLRSGEAITSAMLAILSLMTETAPSNETASFDTKVPRSEEAINALMKERKGLWEYRLYAGLLRRNLDALEPKYRDHVMGYARANGTVVATGALIEHVQAAMGSLLITVGNFNKLMDPRAQEAAFGRPGEPGDVDQIVHLAQRFASVYEDLMDWSADLRGTSASGDHAKAALEAQAKTTDQPLQAMRAFVNNFVAQMDTIEERLASGEEDIRIEMVIEITLNEDLSAELQREVEAALQED